MRPERVETGSIPREGKRLAADLRMFCALDNFVTGFVGNSIMFLGSLACGRDLLED